MYADACPRPPAPRSSSPPARLDRQTSCDQPYRGYKIPGISLARSFMNVRLNVAPQPMLQHPRNRVRPPAAPPTSASWSSHLSADVSSIPEAILLYWLSGTSVVTGRSCLSRSVMGDEERLASTVFSGLSALVIEDVQNAGEVILVRARTPGRAMACPDCGTETARVHGYHERMAADVPVDGRHVLVRIRVRRMRCPVTGCPRR